MWRISQASVHAITAVIRPRKSMFYGVKFSCLVLDGCLACALVSRCTPSHPTARVSPFSPHTQRAPEDLPAPVGTTEDPSVHVKDGSHRLHTHTRTRSLTHSITHQFIHTQSRSMRLVSMKTISEP